MSSSQHFSEFAITKLPSLYPFLENYMAEEVLFNFVGDIIKKLGSGVLQQIGLWWGANDELEKLKHTFSSIHAVLLDAEEKSALNNQVKLWLGKLKEVVYEVDDLLDDLSTEALSRQTMGGNEFSKEVCLFFSSSNRIVYGCEMGHEIKAIRVKLDAIAKDRQDYRLDLVERFSEVPLCRGRDQTISFVDEKEVIGREDDKNAIIDLLLDSKIAENVSIISIVGIGGLGKTTLAQYVYNDEKIKIHFEQRLWVCVSDVFDLKLIVEKTIKSTDKEPGHMELDQLQRRLQNEISGKKYLLVLDDIWNEDLQKWLELKALLMCGAMGSRILITTRSEKVATITGGKLPRYSLKGLALDKSWYLFKKIVFEGQEPKNPKVREIGEQIIKKCVGVPLAIKTIASVLYFKDPEREWLPFLENDLSRIAQSGNKILNTLKLSYDHLSSHLKHCFAYCALFPKDYVINVKTLIHLWVAQGFIESSNSGLCAEDIGLWYFMELSWRSFFSDVERDELGNVESCKMHDLMQDLATLVAGKEISIINSKEENVDKSVRHVSFHQIPVRLSNAKKWRTFLLPGEGFCSYDVVSSVISPKLLIPKVMVSSFTDLRVCDMHYSRIVKVPNSIKRLTHLRYLDVSHNGRIMALPNFITDLQNLQVLNVSYCMNLRELPKDFKNLVNLRHLYCSGCVSLTHMPRGLGKLTSLQTLSVFMVAKDSSVSKYVGGLNELNSLNNLRGSLKLKNLGYVKHGLICPNLKEKSLLQSLTLYAALHSTRDDRLHANLDYEELTFQNLQPHPNLKELWVGGYRGLRFPCWLSSLTNLVNIKIYDCNRIQYLPPMHHLPYLQRLQIWTLYDLQYIEIEGQGTSFFSSLKSLQIKDCPKLIGWRRKMYEDDSDDSTTASSPELLQFPCLSEFQCHRCPNLSWIPQFPSLDEVLELDEVSTQLVQQILTTSVPSSAASSSSSVAPPLSKLKKLMICHIKELKYLPRELCYLTSLRELFIEDCPNLKERCGNKNGVDWPFISHIPNIRLDRKRVQWEGCYLLEDNEKTSEIE